MMIYWASGKPIRKENTKLIGDLRRVAFNFRNWLAHGRYLVRDGQKYDYATIYALAATTLNSFPLFGPLA